MQAVINITPSPPDSRKVAAVPTRTPKYGSKQIYT